MATVEATIHHEYRTRLNELKSAYAPFDPDSDTRNATSGRNATEGVPYSADLVTQSRLLFERFNALLTRANYRRLTREELEEALRTPNHGGLELKLDLSIFEQLEIYVRGNGTTEKSRRDWRTAWRDRTQAVPIYRRLAIIFRLKEHSAATDPLGTRPVVLKLFKDIPQHDVETLLPGGSIRISWVEQMKIMLPTLSGIGLTLFKLLKGAAAVAFVSVYGLIAFLALVSGAVGYGLRSFHGYLRTREKYQLNLTRHLYFQNLDNNAGVIYHLLAEAEEQEFREVVLAYWLLWRGGMAGATSRQLDQAAELWLRECCGIDADFEIADALAKLQRLGLAATSPLSPYGRGAGGEGNSSPLSPRGRGAGGEGATRWRALPIEAALATLDRAWDDCFDYSRATEHAESLPFVQPPRLWRAAA